MNEETIVAVFDTPAQADAAIRDLIAAEVPESAISRHAPTPSGMAATNETVAEPPREEGFWSKLFGGDREYDHQVYDRSMEGGSTVISVHVAEAHVMQVSEILDRHNPVDIDERASGYGIASATTAGTAGVAPVGYAETQYDEPIARPVGLGDEHGAAPVGSAYQTTGSANAGETETLQLAEEQLAVGKRLLNRGTTRVRRYVVETPVEEQITLHEERVTLDRRPVTGVVAPGVGSFTDRTIEMAETQEEAVVSKTAHVTEEIRLQKEGVDRVETIRDTVRHEEAEVVSTPDEAIATTRR